MLEIFHTPTVAQAISAFVLHGDEWFGAEELSHRLGVTRPAVVPILARLLADGIIERKVVGQKHLYRAVASHPLFGELRGIALKTFGARGEILRTLREDKRVLFVAIYGSFARGDERPGSDIDLLVLLADDADEELDYELAKKMARVGRTIGRHIHLAAYPVSEWARSKATNDIARAISSSEMLVLKGNLSDA